MSYETMKEDIPSVCDTGACRSILIEYTLGYHFDVSKKDVERAIDELIDEEKLFFDVVQGKMQDFIRPTEYYPRGFQKYKEFKDAQ